MRHAKGTWADKEALSLKNQWLQHLVLADPETESSGVRLRAVEGLAGVKFLDPDSFMGLAAEASCLAKLGCDWSVFLLSFGVSN